MNYKMLFFFLHLEYEKLHIVNLFVICLFVRTRPGHTRDKCSIKRKTTCDYPCRLGCDSSFDVHDRPSTM